MRRLLRLSTFRVALLSALALGLVGLPASDMAFVRQLEGQLPDLRFRLRAPRPVSDAIVLVRIDDRSLREVGRWPWSRAVMAHLVERLQTAGARTIGLDLLLAEREPEPVPALSLEALRGALQDAPPGLPGTEGLDRALARFLESAQGDRVLAQRLENAGNAVLPILFEMTARPGPGPEPPPHVAGSAFRVVQEPGGVPTLGWPPVASALLAPIPELGQAAAGLGHGNVLLDRDGTARFDHPAIGFGGNYYPSFSLEIARLFLDVPATG